jgi:hypothetical protein
MARDKLIEYDQTAANNTVIGDVNTSETMLPSEVNDAFREQMSHLKEALGSGTPLYVDQTNNRVGVNNAAPSTAVDVTGTVTATSFAGDGSALTGIQAGAGYFQGNNGDTGDTTNGKGDIFRVNAQTLTSNVTIATADNATAAGPLTIDASATLTVNGNLTIL